ncbi:MAG: efflux RND transporter permease subunit [Candidatus Eutrophobiaceae bacterium]
MLHAFYHRFILDAPVAVIVVLVALLLCVSAGLPNFRLDASADSLLLEGDQDLKLFREVNERYGSRPFLFVTFAPNAPLLSDESLEVIRQLRADFVELPGVESVISLLDVPLMEQIPGGLGDIAENIRTLDDPGVDREKARAELLASPIYRELIISLDGRSTALQINLEESPRFVALARERARLRETGDAVAQARLRAVEVEYQALNRASDKLNSTNIERIRVLMEAQRGHGELHLGGVPMVVHDMIAYIQKDLIVFGAGVFLFLVVMLKMIFRKWHWILLPLASCIYAGAFMLGLLGLLDWKVTVISSNFLSLMLIITMSMNIHLIVRYRQLRHDYPDYEQRRLVSETVAKMVWPCLYTALTTIVAFCSLVFSGIKPVIDFGWMMTAGLCVSFLVTFFLFPCLLVRMPRTEEATISPEGYGEEAGSKLPREQRGERYRVTAVLADLAAHHGRKVLVVSGLLAVASVWGISQLEVENSFINYFSEDTEIYRGLSAIDRALGGTTPLDVVLNFPERENASSQEGSVEQQEMEDIFAAFEELEEEKHEKAWLTEERINDIKRVHDYLDSLPAIGKVLSLASVVRVGEAINGSEFDDFQLAVLSRRIPPLLKTAVFDPYLSEDAGQARISVRVLDSLPNLRRKELIERIQGDIERLGFPPERFQISGLLVLYNNMLQSLFQSQIQTLGVVMAGIALMLLALFRSVTLAVVGIIPNVLAAGVILGLMGIARIPLDMMTITIAAITIGIAVDNSIHYIYRFREEFPRFRDYRKTMRYCHANIGRAVFYTAITIIVGFSILVFSNFVPTVYFGLLTALAMSIALFAVLTLLPKLILLTRPFGKEQ